MLKTFHVSGYAVNKRGNTVGIRYSVQAAGAPQAKQTAAEQATAQGYRHPYLSSAIARRTQHG